MAMNSLNKQEKANNTPDEKRRARLPIRKDVVNPKAVSEEELYGANDDQNPPNWQDGIFSTVLKEIVDIQDYQCWMILDGPVDTLWVESLNSVMDDSKLLTLTNGDRIRLSNNMNLLFEVENLAVASPATVSRAGMIYMDIEELGWEPYMKAWINNKDASDEYKDLLTYLAFEKYLPRVLKQKRSMCEELAPSSESGCVIAMCKLFDALNAKFSIKRGEEESQEDFNIYIEKWFLFSMIWSIGATVDEQSRKHIDYILRELEAAIFPASATVYEYVIKEDKRDFVNWDSELKGAMMQQESEFHKIVVPTVDTVRNRYVVEALIKQNINILVVGMPGVGKTVLMNGVLRSLDHQTSSFVINFSAGTTSNATQTMIEGHFERRAKNKYKPKNAKSKIVCFIDDLNMPRRDKFFSQPPLELIRQWMDYSFWWDREKITMNEIQGLQIISCMGKPGGGRQPISNRIVSNFHMMTYTQPDQANMLRIYQTIATMKFTTFEEDIKAMSEPLARATIEIFKKIQLIFLPTPSKSHYVFNMRDCSKVFQGVYLANKHFYDSREHITKLWSHEVLRVFQDRLNTQEDRDQFKTILDEQLNVILDMNYEEHCMTDGKDAIFVDFMNDMDEEIYQEVTDFPKLRARLNESLKEYNSKPKLIKMDLVLFVDAIIHITKIYRILNLPRGHALLIGVGGSGRHSLTRLASFLQKMNVFQLEVTKGFKLKNFREFLKEMYNVAGAGMDVMKTTFIFSDNDVIMESFLEDIQNMLNLGLVPNLYASDEMSKLREDFRRKYRMANKGAPETPDAMDTWFFNNVTDNLHLSICFSPLHKSFKDFCRSYPALINNTTIDWFMRWPDDALHEVAVKFIGEMESIEEQHVEGIASMCAYTHSTSVDAALKMQLQLNRIFYVTPTNYIELLKGYRIIVEQQRKIVVTQAKKLRDGLSALEDARKQVEKASGESDIKRQEVQRNSREVDDLLQQIAVQRKAADEKMAQISIDEEKINKEKAEAEQLASEAKADLAVYEPELLAAEEEIKKLDGKSIAEIKAYAAPPPAVMTVLSAVMIILGHEASWQSAKKNMDARFLKTIQEYNKETTSQQVLKKIERFTSDRNFQPKIVGAVSVAAGVLCTWVKAIESFAKALKTVAPKRARVEYAEKRVADMMAQLQSLKEEFAVLEAKLQEFEALHQTKQAELDGFKALLNDLRIKIERGEKLVSGLQNEKLSWEATIDTLDLKLINQTGDCLMSAAFMSYCGPFPSEYRKDLISNWINMIQVEKLPYSDDFDFSRFMASDAQAREWQLKGLPTDSFSVENGCFVNMGLRWALNIDPQTQAMNWIRRSEPDLLIADQKNPTYLKIIEQGIRFGKKVLFLDVGEEIDAVLDNVLNKSLIQVGRNYCVKIGDKEIEYDPKFKLYITTRMSNPHYTPEVSTKVTVVNFTVKQEGLEEQCLDIVVELEQPSVKAQRDNQITTIEENNKIIRDLEDDILKKLQDADPELILENVALVDTLAKSKEKQTEVKDALASARIVMKRNTEMREQYRRVGAKASVLFFVLNDLNKINPMYQFSLDWYKALFRRVIHESGENGKGLAGSASVERTDEIIHEMRKTTYTTVCQSLFEKDKLLLSMQICISEQMNSETPPNSQEWNFFLKGGEVLDRATQLQKPEGVNWITDQAWDNITELDKLSETFKGIAQAVGVGKDWQRWYQYDNPEERGLPGEWQTKCEERLKAMIVLRCLRPDRVQQAIKKYVEEFLGPHFTKSVPTNLKDIFSASKSSEPVVFVLTTGVDPTPDLKKLADDDGTQMIPLSMGRGQGDKLESMLKEAAQVGRWIFLANCHLSIFLLPEMEKIMDDLFKNQDDPKVPDDQKVKDNFRLILSAEKHPDFSISLLQRSLKITQEPPKGIRPNMYTMYGTRDKFFDVEKDVQFRKAVFGLTWFHTILIERKKFKSLGWNVSYAFNKSDFEVCEDLLAVYMGKIVDGKLFDDKYNAKEPIPWPALNTLIADCNYGGRVTDDRDRLLLTTLAKEIFNDQLVVKETKWKPPGTEDLKYEYPADEGGFKGANPAEVFTPKYFQEQILDNFETVDLPMAYGQHVNAEITSMILDTNELLQSILVLTPQDINTGGGEGDGGLMGKIKTFAENVPEDIDRFALRLKLKADSQNPLNVVLSQEVERYGVVLEILRRDLEQLELGLKGMVVITPELEQIVNAILQNNTPDAWNVAYFSSKPLSNWFEDLVQRYDFFAQWAERGAPTLYWIGALTYPTGFTTCLLQKFSRKASGAPIDQLTFEYIVQRPPAADIVDAPKDGAFIYKMYLENAQWDYDNWNLNDPAAMELTCAMPVVHFKPVTKSKKLPVGLYSCPCYYYPKRQGTVTKDSYQISIELKSGPNPIEYWIKRGTAILFSLGN